MIVCTENVFTLHTTHTSYQLAVAPNGMVLHTYYGTRLPEDVPSLADARMPHSDPGCWPDLLPQELPAAAPLITALPPSSRNTPTARKRRRSCSTVLKCISANPNCPTCRCSGMERVWRRFPFS